MYDKPLILTCTREYRVANTPKTKSKFSYFYKSLGYSIDDTLRSFIICLFSNLGKTFQDRNRFNRTAIAIDLCGSSLVWWALEAQSNYICRVQSSVWRLPKYWPPTPPPLHPASVSSPRTKGAGGGSHSPGGEGVGGQHFGRSQTLDWPLTV